MFAGRSLAMIVCVSLSFTLFSREAFAQNPTPNNPPRRRDFQAAAISEAAKVERDIVYGKAGDTKLKLDVFLPKQRAAKPTPAVVYVHGGGWRSGNKSSGGFYQPVVNDLLKRGYVVASVDYRLAPEARFPAFIEDCKCAVRYLRAEAKQYDIDAMRIGAYGTSAGGHLVSLLGTADAAANLEGTGGHADQSSCVQAVVNLFGPNDLTLGSRRLNDAAGPFGDAEMRKKASPVTYVTKDDPPFLIIHGDADTTVPVEQARILHKALDAAGVENTLVVVEGGAHGLGNEGIKPTKEECVKQIGDFFDKHLLEKKK